MRRAWATIFLLCMACMIYMSGLCLAADGDWIKIHHQSNFTYYVNPTSIKVHEWGGRKFLEVKVYNDQRFGNTPEENFREEDLIVIDVENRKYVSLEVGLWDGNQKGGITSVNDISKIVNGKELLLWYNKLINWVEKNRPEIINEIRTHNQTAPSLESLRNAPPENSAPGTQAQPGGNVDVTGATNVPSNGSLEDIVDDIEYEVLDSGAVKFKIHNSYSVEPDRGYYDTYYIFAKPNEYKDYPGTYMTGVLFDDVPELIAHGFPSYFGHAFDFDPKTQTFIFYWWDFDDPNKSGYLYKTRLTGKNTAYEALYRGFQLINEGAPKIGSETAYRYVPYDSLPWKVSEVQPDRHIVYMEGGQGGVLLPVSYFDDNKCVWYGEVRNYDHDEVTNYVTLDWQYFDLRADLMKAVLAVNGNIGQAFCPVFFTAR